ncbi:MAG: urea carboxylase-associated family protein [Candidatus Rokubacteria bacterium]|nr:urea carboxylase-associated family protein [Candidatus Rokubacteria bacterium]
MEEILVRGRTGHAFVLARGERFKVVDVQGKQVSDLVAFLRDDPTERFSPGNTRKLNGRLKISRGGILYSTKCRPLLRITEDTVGEHDLLFSSCSAYDYRVRFGLTAPHASCLGILAGVLAPYGVSEPMIPDPFNIFQHTEVTPEWGLVTREPLSKPGDFIELQAEADCLVALTACPQDRNPCNGWTITDIKVILG